MTSKEEAQHENLLDAVESGSMELVSSRLHADSSSANSGLDGGSRPLHRAKIGPMAELLIRHGADVNAKGIDDMTPLHVAARDGKLDVIMPLIKSGANVNAIDGKGRSVLSYAAQEQYDGRHIAKALLEAGAHYDITSAASLGDVNEVKRIVANDGQAIRSVPSTDALLSGVLFNSNCEEPNRRQILGIIVDSGINTDAVDVMQFAKAADDQGDKELADMLRQLLT